MPMGCIFPDCREIYCQDCPAGQEGWEEFEPTDFPTPELKAVFDAAFEREFGSAPLRASRPRSLPPRVVG
jgi:hypothetical protein